MKKTRQRVHRPVSRKGKQTQRQYRDLKKQLCDKTLRSRWDNRSSREVNIKKFSLHDFEDRLADDAALQQKTPFKPLNERELVLLHQLHKKYGDDVQAMLRDKKLNVYQWTRGQCEKLLQLYKQRHVCSSAKQYLCHNIYPEDAAATSPAELPPAAARSSSTTTAAAAPPSAAAAPAPAASKRVNSKRRRATAAGGGEGGGAE